LFERLVRYLAITLSLFVAVGFTLFALDDFGRASNASQQRIADSAAAASPTPAGERERERRHGDARELIDDVNDVLLAPFAGISDGADSRWAQRGIPALLGLLVYGFGLGYVARFMMGGGGARPQRDETRRARPA
jgi:hypothetical protein